VVINVYKIYHKAPAKRSQHANDNTNSFCLIRGHTDEIRSEGKNPQTMMN